MLEGIKNKLDASTFDFVGKRVFFGRLSLILVILSWLAFGLLDKNWGIDFTGGTEIHLRFTDDIAINEVRDALADLGISKDQVQEVGGEGANEFKIRIKDAEFGASELKTSVVTALQEGMPEGWVADWDKDVRFSAEVGARFSILYQGERTLPSAVAPALVNIDGAKVEEGREDNEIVVKLPGLATQIEKIIQGAMEGREFTVESVDAVGPKVGDSLRRQGFSSLAATLVLVLIYVAFRFDVAFAPGAIVALVHDVSLTVGVFMLLGKEFNLPIIGALLTIVGYSLNDTIVIYDRIRENRSRYSREDLPGLINVSINETLTRTIATSATTFFAISPFLFLPIAFPGAQVISDFVLAMLCGIIFGTYSTMYIASPMILVMERVKPHLANLIAIDTGGDVDEGDDIPDEFLSESEKRKRERELRAKELEGNEADL